MPLTIQNYSRKVIYPQPNPGGKQFNEFVGVTIMPDGRPLVGCIEAFPTSSTQSGRDWSQTKPQQHFLLGPGFKASTPELKADDFTRPLGKVKALPAFTCQPLHQANGMLFGRDNGEDLTTADAWTGPRTAVLVVRPVSGGSWAQKGTFGIDPAANTAQFSRIHDNYTIGGMRATGQRWPAPAGQRVGVAGTDPCLQISKDGGFDWQNGLFFEPGQKAMTFFNEWDSAELPNGDLAVMVRCGQGWKRQGTFATPAEKKAQLSSIYAFAVWPARGDGSGWNYVEPKKVSFSAAANPIHPALILDRLTGGLIFASQGPEGFRVTYDRGVTWAALPGVGATNYYPVLAQDPSGTIWCASHTGGDDDINENDQAIVMQSFRLNDPDRKPVSYDTTTDTPEEPPVPVTVDEVTRPGGAAWSNIGFAEANDTNFAYSNLPGGGVETNWLVQRRPDALQAVRDDEVVTEIKFRVRVRRGATGSNQALRNGPFALMKGDQTLVETAKADAIWSTVSEHDEVVSFTGLTLMPDVVRADDFGLAATFLGTGTPVQVQVNSFAVISVETRPFAVVDPPPDALQVALARIAELESELATAQVAMGLVEGDLESALADLDRLETAVDGALALLKPLRPVS